MPSASRELQEEWGTDTKAIEFLTEAGYSLRVKWTWDKPTPKHTITDQEYRALKYLIDEWDFGGIE